MMAVIALVGNKGGAGKTTLAVNLAAALAPGAPTVMLDADPQGSSLQWREFTENENAPEVYQAHNDLEDQVESLVSRFRYIVIDCPPSVHAPQTHAALRASDIALIPVQPSPVDLWATIHIERAISEARGPNPKLRSLLVVNQLEPRTTLSALVRDALAEIELPVANTSIRRRAIYRSTALEGKTVFDVGKRGAQASEELDELVKEVLSQ